MVKMMPDPVRLRHDHRVRLGNHRRGLAAPHEDVYARQCRPPPQRRREQRQIGRRLRGHPCLTIRRSFRCTERVLFGAHLVGLRRHAMRDVARSLDRAGTRDAAAGEHRPILGRRRHRSVFTQPGTSNPTTPGARVGRRGRRLHGVSPSGWDARGPLLARTCSQSHADRIERVSRRMCDETGDNKICPVHGESTLLGAQTSYPHREEGARDPTDLAVAALRNALALREPVGRTLHSDHGSQFRSRKFVELLSQSGITGSMGRVSACADNAAMESFFALLQKNVLNTKRWHSKQELRLEIVTWIERTSPPTPPTPTRKAHPDRVRDNQHRGRSRGLKTQTRRVNETISSPPDHSIEAHWQRVCRL